MTWYSGNIDSIKEHKVAPLQEKCSYYVSDQYISSEGVILLKWLTAVCISYLIMRLSY